MDNQFSVLSFRIECSVATSPDRKRVVLKSLYYRFQIGIGRSTSCIGRRSTLDSMFELVQLGRAFFAGIWDCILFDIGMSTVYADKVAKHVEPANLSMWCNGTVDIGLRANNTNLTLTDITAVPLTHRLPAPAPTLHHHHQPPHTTCHHQRSTRHHNS
jgi:hypothetical protein